MSRLDCSQATTKEQTQKTILGYPITVHVPCLVTPQPATVLLDTQDGEPAKQALVCCDTPENRYLTAM
jgi:hypothetical protein